MNSNRPRISIRIGGAPGVGEDGQPLADVSTDAEGQPTVILGADSENAGNRISVGIRPRGEVIGTSEGAPVAPGEEDFMNEEDRLAYLRAQATQDAALAGVGPANGNTRPAAGGKWGKPGQPAGGGRPGGGRGDGARGPKGRGGGRRGRFQRGLKPGEGGGITPAGTGGGITINASSSSEGGGESGSGNGGGDTGGGDRSNPPS